MLEDKSEEYGISLLNIKCNSICGDDLIARLPRIINSLGESPHVFLNQSNY